MTGAGAWDTSGCFLEDPLAVPWAVVDYLAEQLDIENASVIERYTDRKPTAYEYSWEIRKRHGYREFDDP